MTDRISDDVLRAVERYVGSGECQPYCATILALVAAYRASAPVPASVPGEATTGEPSAVEFAERLRHCIRSGWHNHAIVRELDAFAARAVSAERERLREIVGIDAWIPWSTATPFDRDTLDRIAVLVADLRAGKEER